MTAEELIRPQGVISFFLGQFDTYRDMMKRAERKAGNLCLCYTKKHGGYSQYAFDGKYWRLIQIAVEEVPLAGYGKCIVTGKLQVMGKGWVLIIDAAPHGLAVGRKMRCNNDDFQYTVSGFGGLRHMTQKELILSPNSSVAGGIKEGDVLQLLYE